MNAERDDGWNRPEPRAVVLEAVAQRIGRLRPGHPVRVAVDGVDAAGKTTLADALAAYLAGLGRPVIRASVDDFQQPSQVRYRRGRLSAEGYYHDAFDYDTLVTALLRPLGPAGNGRYRPAAFDYRVNAPLTTAPILAPPDAVLLLDGVFLLRPSLRRYWEFSLFVRADFAVTLARALARDARVFGSAATVAQRYRQRYIPGQRLYLATANPEAHADVVIDNNDPARPFVVPSTASGPLAPKA